MMIKKITYNKIYEKIKAANNILLVTHENPDVDALSSTCAMIDFLERIDKNYFAYCFNTPPYKFNFIPHVEKINSNKEELNFSLYDLIIVFDCGGLNRTKLAEEIKKRNDNQLVIEIDHHLKVDEYADIEARDFTRASTTEIVYEFFKTNKIKINKNIANAILAGILTDSGNFLYPSTSDRTIEISSEMLKYGANLPQIVESTWRTKSLTGLKIWGLALARTKINKKYNVAFTCLKKEDVEGADEEDFEGISNFLGNLHNVKAIMVLRETEDNIIKGSLRSSHPDINVANLAKIFGGGGHAKAAGFKIVGKIIINGEECKIL